MKELTAKRFVEFDFSQNTMAQPQDGTIEIQFISDEPNYSVPCLQREAKPNQAHQVFGKLSVRFNEKNYID